MALIPDDVINEIRARADIVAVIGRHVDLRKAGRNHKGLCPFHHERSPSFNVNGDKQFFYCFGCQKKGDVFTFVMEYEGKSFHEAAESLAAIAGVTIPETTESPLLTRQRSERSGMLALNRLATGFFHEVLLDPRRGAEGRRYLSERGINDQTIRAFQLGYAPDDWRALSDYLAAQRASAELAVALGLIARQPRAGGYYDRFRDRLMCPVVLPGGEIAGFSGRRLKDGEDADKSGAKYINSPESSVYKKSKLLFGLDRARDAFRRTGRALLVEGNFDVINLHQAGFDETVAPLGTALTPEQVDLLRRLADEVILLYDGDRAGRAAALKSLEILVDADVRVRIAELPAGEDPDSVVARGGREALTAILDRAQPGIEYFVFEVWSREAQSADGRATALEQATRLLQKVANPTKRDLITGTLAAAMRIDPGLIRRAIERRSPRNDGHGPHPAEAHGSPPRQPQPTMPSDQQQQQRSQPSPGREGQPPAPAPQQFELALLAILADHPQLMETAEEHGVFSLLTDARLQAMYCAARQGTSMLAVTPDDISPLIAKHVLAGSYATVTDPEHCLLEAVSQLRQGQRRRRLAELQRQADDAKRRGDSERERQLVREILTTRRQVD